MTGCLEKHVVITHSDHFDRGLVVMSTRISLGNWVSVDSLKQKYVLRYQESRSFPYGGNMLGLRAKNTIHHH